MLGRAQVAVQTKTDNTTVVGGAQLISFLTDSGSRRFRRLLPESGDRS